MKKLAISVKMIRASWHVKISATPNEPRKFQQILPDNNSHPFVKKAVANTGKKNYI
jgi:hypothetical protein